MKIKEILRHPGYEIFLHEENPYPKVIEGDVYVPPTTIHLTYHNTIVEGSFYCNTSSTLRSLEGSPLEVTKSFFCYDTAITSLRGSPRKVGEIYSCADTNIESVEGITPFIGNYLDISKTKVKSFKNIHRHIKHVKSIYIPDALESGMLDLLKIRSLQYIKPIPSGTFGYGDRKVTNELLKALGIINRQLMGERNIHKCQEELIEAGLEEFAL